jgi:hypothetical protein
MLVGWSRLAIALVLAGWQLPAYAAAVEPSGNGDLPSQQSDAPRLIITSDSQCPSGPAVAEALAALVPAAEWPNGTVELQSAADSCVVHLMSEISSERRLSLPADCGLRASTVALVIATWTGALASEAAGAPILRSQATVNPSPSPAPSPAPSVTSATERELGAGVLLSLSGGPAPGGRLDFVQTRAPRGLGWQVGLAASAPRERAVAGGTTSWTRAAVDIGVNGRITLRRFALSAHAGLAGTYTFTSGHGYSVDQSSEALTGGMDAGARIAVTWRRLRVWTDVRGTKWLFPQSLAVRSPEGERVTEVALPSFDFQWALGLSYLFP